MSALDDLFEELWSMEYRTCGDQERAKKFAREFLDKHAHELAEQIRIGHPDRCPDFADGAEWAADSIDPEVTT